VDEAAMRLLLGYPFPGNIRELRATVQAAANLAQGGTIVPSCLPSAMRRLCAVNACAPASTEGPLSLAEVERRHIHAVLAHTGGNKSSAARLLGIGLNTLRRKLRGGNPT
jgi:DNA-binding NtrC family response regulator